MAGEENIDSSKNICYHFDRNKTENINGICNFIIMDFHCHQQLERHLVHTTMWLCDTIVVNYLLVWKFISTWLYDWSLSILDCDATIYGSISELLKESTASHSRPEHVHFQSYYTLYVLRNACGYRVERVRPNIHTNNSTETSASASLLLIASESLERAFCPPIIMVLSKILSYDVRMHSAEQWRSSSISIWRFIYAKIYSSANATQTNTNGTNYLQIVGVLLFMVLSESGFSERNAFGNGKAATSSYVAHCIQQQMQNHVKMCTRNTNTRNKGNDCCIQIAKTVCEEHFFFFQKLKCVHWQVDEMLWQRCIQWSQIYTQQAPSGMETNIPFASTYGKRHCFLFYSFCCYKLFLLPQTGCHFSLVYILHCVSFVVWRAARIEIRYRKGWALKGTSRIVCIACILHVAHVKGERKWGNAQWKRRTNDEKLHGGTIDDRKYPDFRSYELHILDGRVSKTTQNESSILFGS